MDELTVRGVMTAFDGRTGFGVVRDDATRKKYITLPGTYLGVWPDEPIGLRVGFCLAEGVVQAVFPIVKDNRYVRVADERGGDSDG